MSLHHNPKTSTDGLIMYYDMANTQKSWKGYPTTNQFTLPTAAVNGFGVQNSTFTRVYSGEFGGYDIQASDYVWRYNINGGDCPYHGWDISTTAGAVVTFSFDYYISPTTVGYPSTNYLANFENVGSGVGGSVADPTPSIIGVWKRAYITSTATATGPSRCLLYPGACGGALASGTGFILYKNPQVEFNAPGGIPTPFVSGTRSNTQAIVDLTGNNIITNTSLTYASDGTFSFNGSNNYLTISTFVNKPTTAITVESWIRPTKPTLSGTIRGAAISATNSMYLGIIDSIDGGVTHALHWANQTSVSRIQSWNGNIPNNAWSHIAGTYNGTTMRAYLNGVEIYSAAQTGTIPDATYVLGTYGGALVDGVHNFNGILPASKIYNRALSASEIAQNFNALRGRYGI